MLRALDICAAILLAICLLIVLRNKESTSDKIVLRTRGKAGSRLVQEPGAFRDCDNGEGPATAVVEYTFPQGFVPPEKLCPSLLQQLEQVT